jgi:hypothetical protein
MLLLVISVFSISYEIVMSEEEHIIMENQVNEDVYTGIHVGLSILFIGMALT